MYENRRSTPKESPNVNHTENRDDPIGKIGLEINRAEQLNEYLHRNVFCCWLLLEETI